MTTLKTIAVTAAALALVACGGAQKTSKKEMTEIARNAEPPPAVVPGQTIDRKVTREAKEDFKDAIAFYQEQEKAGWTLERCTAAADKFKSVASSHDKLVEAYFNAGVSYQKCGDQNHAEDMYKKAISISPGHAPSLANLGEIYYRGGNHSMGQQYFEQAIKANAQIVAARNNMAWILYTKIRQTSDAGAQKRFEDDALGQLSRVLAVDNDNVFAYTLMALVYMENAEKNRARLDVAKLLLDEGKKRDAKYPPLWNAWGQLELKKDNVGKALEMFRQAVALKPDFVEARMNVAQVVLSFRKYEEAAENFKFVLEAKGQSKETLYDAHVGYGVALRGMKKIDEAQAEYEAAMKLIPDRGDAYYNMGLLWKDFRTNAEDPETNKKAYNRAKGYFGDFLRKSNIDPDKRKEAQENIEDCDKYVRLLDQAIAAMKAAPPPPPPPPSAPAPGR